MNLKFDDKNTNRGTERGRELVRKSLQKYGAGRSILVDKNGKVIAGNKTLEQALAEGIEIEMVKSDGKRLIVHQRTDLDLDKDPAARELAIADNRTSEIGLDWDFDLLAEMNEDFLSEFDFDPNTFFESNGFEGNTDPDEVPEEVETRCKPGDLWQLGRHRLMCGDATNSNEVRQLLDGGKADFVFTDPPYDIKTETLLGLISVLDSHANKNIIVMLIDGAAVELLRNCDWHLRSFHFAKLSFSIPAGNYFYRRHIPILHFAKSKVGWINTHDSLDSVYDLKKYRGNSEDAETMPHAKPIELPERFIKSFKCSIILDLFGGYGGTLIAAEKQGKSCRMMEIDPHYCDAIITRWENFTGGIAEKVEYATD